MNIKKWRHIKDISQIRLMISQSKPMRGFSYIELPETKSKNKIQDMHKHLE